MGEFRARRIEEAFPLYEIDVVGADDGELLEISKSLGLNLNLEEMRAIKRYFSRIGRNPTDVELQTFGQVWSEHCYHKTFKGVVVTERGEVVENILRTYIARATLELSPEWLVSVFEDNAGIVDFDGRYAIAVKVETHNHPSAVDPFGGAATGIGGSIRDVLGVWAEPIANIDVLCFGPLNYPRDKLPKGIRHPRYLFDGVVAGIGYYGNNMGIPTVCGAICFDEGYVGNVVVYCGTVGILPRDKYVRNVKPGHIAILAGGRTGRDGIHGVTFASSELGEDLDVYRPAVQIPDPIEEEKLRRAILRIRDDDLGSGVTDLGGGGLSSALTEMAHRYGLGVEVALDLVPLKEGGMSPWEIWISESQERMLVAVPPGRLDDAIEVFEEEDVEAVPVASFDQSGMLRIAFKGRLIADLDLNFLFSPPKAVRRAVWRDPPVEEPVFEEPENLSVVLLDMLSSPNIASREEVVRTYDHEVRGCTALKPLHGPRAGPNDAAVLKPLRGSWRGVVISCGIRHRYGRISPYWMAASSIDEAVRNNVAVGGRRIALLDNFTWGNPEKSDRMGALLESVRACYHFAKAFGTPFISGKDSLYNESPLGPVNPTLLITAIGIIPDVRRAVSVDLKRPGNPIYILGLTGRELGGSEYYALMGYLGNSVPKVDSQVSNATFKAVIEAIDRELVVSAHDPSDGGLGVALAEMSLAGGLGAEIDLTLVPRSPEANRDDYILFSESNGRILVEVRRGREEEFESLASNAGAVFARIGVVSKEGELVVRGLGGGVRVELGLKEIETAWRSGLRRG